MFRVMVVNAARVSHRSAGSLYSACGQRDFHGWMDGWVADVMLWPPVTNEYSEIDTDSRSRSHGRWSCGSGESLWRLL